MLSTWWVWICICSLFPQCCGEHLDGRVERSENLSQTQKICIIQLQEAAVNRPLCCSPAVKENLNFVQNCCLNCKANVVVSNSSCGPFRSQCLRLKLFILLRILWAWGFGLNAKVSWLGRRILIHRSCDISAAVITTLVYFTYPQLHNKTSQSYPQSWDKAQMAGSVKSSTACPRQKKMSRRMLLWVSE